MQYRAFGLTIIAALLGACAATQNYSAASDPRDHGYFSEPLGQGHYRVGFNGSAAMPLATVERYALLRAAEVTLENGHDWFQVVSAATVSSETLEPGAAQGGERVVYTQTRCGLLACTYSEEPAPFARPAFHDSRVRETHRRTLEILLGKGELPAAEPPYYLAETLTASSGESPDQRT